MIPPAGWACTREAGHEGPCAAVRYRPLAAREPALAVGLVFAALLSAVRAMGWLTPEQEQAWLAVAVVLAPLAQAAATRRYVSPAQAPE